MTREQAFKLAQSRADKEMITYYVLAFCRGRYDISDKKTNNIIGVVKPSYYENK